MVAIVVVFEFITENNKLVLFRREFVKLSFITAAIFHLLAERGNIWIALIS